jgi:DNA modification methylase
MKIDPKKNTIVCGDNIEWLNWIADDSVDLCYIDPPFFSNRDYEIIWGNGYELRSFGDRFSGGISHYIEWMRPRIELIHKKIKTSGSMFLHCDSHASHRLRCLLDDVFGDNNFRSEIIWKRQGAKGLASTRLPNNHDTIFYYTKSEKFTWNRPFKAQDPEYIQKFYKHIEEGTGRRYQLDNLANPNPNRPNLTYEYRGHLKVWRWTKERMKEADKQGLIYQKGQGVPRLKRYLDENQGKAVDTVWDDIQSIQGQSLERLGYPTQKPEALLHRLIGCASNPDDLVLDCFSGGGTTAIVCAETGRKFIIGDVSPVAIKVSAQRLNSNINEIKFEIKNVPKTEKDKICL